MFHRALDLDPTREDIWLNLSDVLRYDGRLEQSLAALDALERRHPNAPGLWCKRGQVYAVQGRIEEAEHALNRELLMDGPFVELAIDWLGRL